MASNRDYTSLGPYKSEDDLDVNSDGEDASCNWGNVVYVFTHMECFMDNCEVPEPPGTVEVSSKPISELSSSSALHVAVPSDETSQVEVQTFCVVGWKSIQARKTQLLAHKTNRILVAVPMLLCACVEFYHSMYTTKYILTNITPHFHCLFT
ncbi:hypothetical protein PR048_033164 [Dryococelus australis]|uniref:Uncharacterized protein n=1 Tax=Dryococelus australis TaxID=614101 RepID=A0ABQ9FZG9_9NEOP|nr:hypothetical protein PR048_033164 [Dryococelus australis]